MAKNIHEGFGVSQVTVGATATLIAPQQSGQDEVSIENLGTTAVYIGGAGVTTTTGFLLPGVVGASLTIPTTEAVYGIVASGTQAVAVLATA